MTPILSFDPRGVEASLRRLWRDSPPKLIRTDHDIMAKTDKAEQRSELLHMDLEKQGTIFNTLAGATGLLATIRRKG